MAMPTQLCTFHVDSLYLGISVVQVQEVLREQETTPVPLAPDSISGLMNLRGQIVTAIDLRVILGLPPRPADHHAMNVVIRTADGAVSLMVDEIGDVIETGEDTFEPPPDTLTGTARHLVLGVHKLPGALLHVLDVDRVLTLESVPAVCAE